MYGHCVREDCPNRADAEAKEDAEESTA
jgi:hypothetical protein